MEAQKGLANIKATINLKSRLKQIVTLFIMILFVMTISQSLHA
jgi:hypothetical protein